MKSQASGSAQVLHGGTGGNAAKSLPAMTNVVLLLAFASERSLTASPAWEIAPGGFSIRPSPENKRRK